MIATPTPPATAPDELVTLDARALIAELASLEPAPALERIDAALAATRARLVEVTMELARPSRDFERQAARREEFFRLDGSILELEAERPALALAVEAARRVEQRRRGDVGEARAFYEALLEGAQAPVPDELPSWAYELRGRGRWLIPALRYLLAADRERLRSLGEDAPGKLTINL